MAFVVEIEAFGKKVSAAPMVFLKVLSSCKVRMRHRGVMHFKYKTGHIKPATTPVQYLHRNRRHNATHRN